MKRTRGKYNFMLTQNKDQLKYGRWTNKEHERFLEALKLHGTHWILVTQYVGTRHICNVRSHAQKYTRKLTIGKKKVCTSKHKDLFKKMLTERKNEKQRRVNKIKEMIKKNKIKDMTKEHI